MAEDPVKLDDWRSVTGKVATEIRRHSRRKADADQEVARFPHAELEHQLLDAPSETWPQVATWAQYLLRRYAATADARDADHTKLI
jgi:hypothetical protein